MVMGNFLKIFIAIVSLFILRAESNIQEKNYQNSLPELIDTNRILNVTTGN